MPVKHCSANTNRLNPAGAKLLPCTLSSTGWIIFSSGDKMTGWVGGKKSLKIVACRFEYSVTVNVIHQWKAKITSYIV